MNWRPLAVLALAVGVTGIWLWHAPTEQDVRFPMPTTKVYVQECGSCHTAFAPGLLPARAWRKMMAELDRHFGEDATLDEPSYLAILKELETLAADGNYADTRMRRISDAIPQNAAPQRISETAYVRHLHDELPAAVWKQKSVATASNCIACHRRANEGRYGELEVRVP